MSFHSVRDQETAIRLLQNLLVRQRVPNGLMFWGPEGVGKRMTALELTKAVHCRTQSGDACDSCLPCRKVAHGTHPDVKVVSPIKTSRIIHLETMRELGEMAYLRPFESEWRVFLILDAERMTIDAQDYFLKTLEEPPGRSMFILVTEYPRRVLPTIRSRCQLVRFRTLKIDTVAEYLRRERDLPPELAASFAALSQGQISRALDLLDSEKRDIVLAIIRRLVEGADPVVLSEEFTQHLKQERESIEASVKATLGFEAADELSREDMEALKERRVAEQNALIKRKIMEYLYLMETWYRDEFVYSVTRDRSRLLNRDRAESFAAKVSTDAGMKIRAVEKARYYLDRFVNEERVFRDLFFALAAP
ncbi:MAG: DNA polymerase III subunit delta' [Candidatus Hydrogenedentes bacterium]|nr:DNA polymerase III subunit delta' [Candidatus Hydrogenedentota bacterium]